MAMSQKGLKEATRAFSKHIRYTNSTGSLTAVYGFAHNLGGLEDRPATARLRKSAQLASYTVYSYDTPIGWAIEDKETGLFERVIPDVLHSLVTRTQQNVLRGAWAGSYHDGSPEGREAWLRDHRAAV